MNKLTILVIEHNVHDVWLIEEVLSQAQNFVAELIFAHSLSEAYSVLDSQAVDAAVLALNLPDSPGRDAVAALSNHAPHIPIILLAEAEDEDASLEALRTTGRVYLPKRHMALAALEYKIIKSVEENLLWQALQKARETSQQQELSLLEKLFQNRSTSNVAASPSIRPLREASAQLFEQKVAHYQHLLQLSLEQRAYKIDHHTSSQLRDFAQQLTLLNAGPRDVLDIHEVALRREIKGKTARKAHIYLEEARMMTLELMGYLVTHYRLYALAFHADREASPNNATTPWPQDSEGDS